MSYQVDCDVRRGHADFDVSRARRLLLSNSTTSVKRV